MTEISRILVDQARGWLRIQTQSRDEEIRQTLEACLLDLSAGGVKDPDPSDALVRQAMKLYLKSQFGYDENAEKFSAAYEHVKFALALCGTYNGGSSDGTSGGS